MLTVPNIKPSVFLCDIMEKYLMKYDVDGRLYLYLERSKSGKIASMIKISGGNKLLRYDGLTQERHYTKHACDCMLAHRFQADESWVTVVSIDTDISEQYDLPKKTAAFSFDKNGSANLFTVSRGLTTECVSILGMKNKRPHIRIPLGLSNSGLFTNIVTKIAKNVRENIHIKRGD